MLLNDVDIVDERIVGRMGEYTRSSFSRSSTTSIVRWSPQESEC